MPGFDHYVKEYGNISFNEMPFNDADNVAMCGIFYMAVENVVPEEFEENPHTLGEVCKALYTYNGCKHVAMGIMLPKGVSRRFVNIGKYKRFAELKVTACRSVFNTNNVVQFAAATFIMPDGTLLVVYRGTDDTFIGWKEDMDILIKGSIPSYKLAHDYIEEVAKTYDGKIIIAGHSKGGNVALHAALNCSQAVRDRIIALYNNDGPGFADYTPYQTREYRELLPKYRHIVPHASFVGMLLAHDRDYTVVKSSRMFGPMQHDCSTWQIRDGALVTQPELSFLGRICELSLIKLLDECSEEQILNLSRIITTSFECTGLTCLKDMAKNAGTSAKMMVKNWADLDDYTKDTFTASLKQFGKIVAKSYSEVRKGTAVPEPVPTPVLVTAD